MSVKRFVLSGYFGFKNFGDEAILSILVQRLQQDNSNKLTIISSDPKYTCSKFKNVRSVYTFNLFPIIEQILKTDYLISGGGSLLQDATSLKSLIYYLGIIFLGLFFGKKVIIFAQGIGPINNSIGRFFTGILLKHCHYVSVRDEKSFDFLKQYGIDADLLCDPVFSTNISPVEKQKTLAIQLRECKGITEDFIDRLAQKVSKEFYDYNIKVFPLQKSLDTEISHKFKYALNLLNSDINVTVHEDLSDDDIIKEISKCEYLIAMRFHAIIVALLAGVKTLAINYDIKIEKISSEFDIPLLSLKNEFKDEFNFIKNMDIQSVQNKLKSKTFEWTGFENAIK